MPVHYGTLWYLWLLFSGTESTEMLLLVTLAHAHGRCLGPGDAFRCGAKLAAPLVWQLRSFGILIWPVLCALYFLFLGLGCLHVCAYISDVWWPMPMAVGTRLPHSTGARFQQSNISTEHHHPQEVIYTFWMIQPWFDRQRVQDWNSWLFINNHHLQLPTIISHH